MTASDAESEPSPSVNREGSGRRHGWSAWARRGLRIAGIGLAAVASGLLLLLLLLQIDAVATRVVRAASGLASSDALTIRVGGASGSWVRGLRLTDVDVSATQDGVERWSVRADTIAAAYRLLPLIRRRVDVSAFEVSGLDARVLAGEGGPDEGPAADETSPWTFVVDRARVDVRRLALEEPGAEPWLLSNGQVRASALEAGPMLSGILDTVAADFRPPGRPAGWGRLEASGSVSDQRVEIAALTLRSPESDVRARGTVPLTLEGTAPEGLELDVVASPLHLADVAPFLPASMADTLRLQAEATLRTASDTLFVTADAEADVPGRFTLDARIRGPRSSPDVEGRLVLSSLDVDAWGLADQALTADAEVVADLRSVARTGTYGSLRTDAEVTPRDGAPSTSLHLAADADGAGAPFQGDWSVDAMGASGSGTFELDLAEDPTWILEGNVAYAGAGILGAAGRFEARGGGIAETLAADLLVRLDSVAVVMGSNGATVVAGPGRLDASVEGRRALVAALELDVGGGSVRMAAEGDLEARTGRLVRGTVRGVDVATLVGDTVESTLDADIDGALRSLDPLRASGAVRLTTARYGGLSLDSACIDAEADGETARVALRVAAPDSGRVRGAARVGWTQGLRRIALDSLAWRSVDLRALTGAGPSSSLPPSDLSGFVRGDLELEGSEWVGEIQGTVRQSSIAEAVVDSGTVRVALDAGGADLRMTLDAAEARISGSGRWDSGDAPRFVLSELAFQAVDVSAFAPDRAPETWLTGRVEGEWVGASAERGLGRLSLDMDSSRVGTTVIDSVRLDVQADTGVVRADARVAALGATLRMEGDGRVAGGPRSYALTGDVIRRDAAVSDMGGHLLAARFGLRGQGTNPDSLEADAWVEVDSARWSDFPVDAARLSASLVRGTLRVDTLDVRAPGVTIAAGGSLPLRGTRDAGTEGTASDSASEPGDTDDFRIIMSLRNPALLDALPVEGPVGLGQGELELTAAGSLEELELHASGSTDGLLFGTTTAESLTLQASGRRAADRGWIRAEGNVEVDRVRTPTAPLERFEAQAELTPEDELAFNASAVIDGRRDLSVRARVSEASHVLGPSAVTIEDLRIRLDPEVWSLERPTDIAVRSGLRFDSLRLTSPSGGVAHVDGGIPGEGPLDLEARLEGFEIASVTDLLGFPRLRGRMDASVSLSGTAEEPTGQVSLRSRLRPQDAAAGTLDVAVAYEGRSAEVEGTVALDDGGRFAMTGTVPWALASGTDSGGLRDEAPVEAELEAGAFPLAWLEPFLPASAIRELRGSVDGTIRLDGTPHAPDLSGGLALQGGAADLPTLGVRYDEAAGHLSLMGTEVIVDSLRARSGGTVSVTGRIEVATLQAPTYDVRIRADEFEAIRSSGVHATVSGELSVRGAGLAPELSGVVEVERADLYLSELASTEDVDQVTLTDEQWEELARVFGYRRPSEQDRGPALFEAADLDLQVRLGRASWVRQRANPELALQFSGEMSLQKEPGDSLQLVGSVEAVPERSWVEQFGRRFSITRGNLTFQGPPAATRIDATAQYEVPSRDNPGEPEVVLNLGITGTPEDLALELSSTPPLEASDMVSYLVTGRPAGQSLAGGSEGSLTDAGGALALGRLSGAVEAYAREQVGLDVIEVTTDGVDGMTLVAGRYLSPELYLGLRQPISLQRSAGDGSQRAPDSELELELQAVRWLLFNLRAGGRRGVEFYVRSRIAYE